MHVGEDDDVDVVRSQANVAERPVKEGTAGGRAGIDQDVVPSGPEQGVGGVAEGPLVGVEGESVGQDVQSCHVESSLPEVGHHFFGEQLKGAGDFVVGEATGVQIADEVSDVILF